MAITARFAADFTSFQDAVQKAELSLKSFETGAGKVEKSLNKMVDSFTGRKLIQEAALLTRALGSVDDLALLTGQELQRAGTKAAEAADKMRRLGIEVPPGLQRIADTAKAAAAATEQASGSFGRLAESAAGFVGLGGLLSGAGIAAALIGASKSALAYADTLSKLSDQTSINVESLQRLQAIAEPSGNTLEQVAQAVSRFQKNLSTGEAAKALGDLNLSLSAMKALSPDEQFIAIAKAIQGIKDPADQTRIAMELFGRGGAEILPTLKAKIDELKDSTLRLSSESVKALDDLGDAFGRLKSNIVVLVGDAVSAIGRLETRFGLLNLLTGNLDATLGKQFADDLSRLVVPQVQGLAKAMGEVYQPTIDADRAFGLLTSGLDAQAAAIEATRKAQENLLKGQNTWQLGIGQLNQRVPDLTAHLEEARAAIEEARTALLALGATTLDQGRLIEQATGKISRVFQTLPNVGPLNTAMLTAARAGSASFAQEFVKDLPVTIQRAFEGGGDVLGAVGALLGKHLATSLTKNLGLAINADDSFAKSLGKSLASSGITAGIDLAINAVVNALKKIGAPSQHELDARDTFAKFQAQFGSLDDTIQAIGKAYADTGRTGVQAEEDIRRALDATHISAAAEAQALNQINVVLAEAKKRAAEVSKEFDGIVSALGDVGNVIPASLGKMITELIRSGKLTDEQVDKLHELLNQGPDFDKLERIASKYGTTLSHLGGKLAQSGLDRQFQSIYSDLKTLEEAGGDTNLILAAMSGDINKLVQDAKKFGLTIPKQFEPYLRTLLASGQLVDENGKKLTDLSGISFADTPLVTALDKLNKLLQDLINYLNGVTTAAKLAAGAIREIPPPGTVSGPNEPEPPRRGPDADMVATVFRSAQHFGKGGKVLPFPGPDRIPALLSAGETVRTPAQEAALSKGGGVVVYLTVTDSVVTNKRAMDDLAASISDKISRGVLGRVKLPRR